MIEKKSNSLSVWFFENLLRHDGIGHFVSTRTGGHSRSPYGALNLSFNVGDDPEKVLKNRKLLAGTLGIALTNVTTAKQIHEGQVGIIAESLRGKGSIDYDGAIDATDAMVTNVPNVCLMILVADCVPILFYDPLKGVIGVAHAGWRGSLQCVAQNTLKVLQQYFGCLPQDILVGIGPSIGPCCYQVSREVISEVEDIFGAKQGFSTNKSADGTGYLDLWTLNREQLILAGIPENNIEVAQVCTCDHPELFYSYRHENGKTGRFGAGIVIR